MSAPATTGAARRPGGPAGMGPMGRPGGMGPMGMVGMPGQKARNFRGTLGRFLGYFATQRLAILTVLVTAILSTLFNIVGP